MDGFLDPFCGPEECRLQVLGLRRVAEVDDLYFVRRARLRLLADYLREVGMRTVFQKVRSRRAERYRNSRHLACGIAEVVEAGSCTHLQVGERVVFIATKSAACADRIVVNQSLARPAPDGLGANLTPDRVHYFDRPADTEGLGLLAGWDAFSGRLLVGEVVDLAFADAVRLLEEVEWARTPAFPSGGSTASDFSERQETASADRPSATLIGWGNFAKTTILPNVEPALDVSVVHEVDPLQIGPSPPSRRSWSTAPTPREDTDVLLIAGYHHTHGPLAASGLRKGNAVIVEKPIVTTREQLEDLLAAMAEGGRLFPCFQRRHSRINAWIREDFGRVPLDYHCLVFEEPLPAHHWYRWPSSGSRLISNGCHWTDHFLFLNDFSSPISAEVIPSRGGEVLNVTVELSNGAVFTMVLTDAGSARVGMRESVQIRAGGSTATILDGRRYEFEATLGRRRSRSAPKSDAYRVMYRDISTAVRRREPGETVERLGLTASLTLRLDEILRREQEPR